MRDNESIVCKGRNNFDGFDQGFFSQAQKMQGPFESAFKLPSYLSVSFSLCADGDECPYYTGKSTLAAVADAFNVKDRSHLDRRHVPRPTVDRLPSTTICVCLGERKKAISCYNASTGGEGGRKEGRETHCATAVSEKEHVKNGLAASSVHGFVLLR
jgi:hypothetical protein